MDHFAREPGFNFPQVDWPEVTGGVSLVGRTSGGTLLVESLGGAVVGAGLAELLRQRSGALVFDTWGTRGCLRAV